MLDAHAQIYIYIYILQQSKETDGCTYLGRISTVIWIVLKCVIEIIQET